MADEPQDDELLLDQPAPEGDEQQEEQGSDKPGEVGEEELEVTFGDEAAPASGDDSGLVRHLREQIRERDRRLSELSKRAAPAVTDPGPRPKLAEYDFDEEAHDKALDEWLERKAQAEATKSQSTNADEQVREQWNRDVQAYEAKKASLAFPDVKDAEENVVAALSQTQQAAIIASADNAALVFYALGKNPLKLAEVSRITNPLKLAAAVARLEQGVKVMPKRRAPDPEEIASGSASVTHGTDKELERLEKEAAKSGDRSKIAAYKRTLRQSA